MRGFTAAFALFLLLAGCGGNPPVVVTPPPVPVPISPAPVLYIPEFIREKFPMVRLLDERTDPQIYVDGAGDHSVIRPALERATQQIRSLGREPKLEGLVVIQFRPVNCKRTAIFIDDVMDLATVEELRRTYPNSFVDGKPCVNGFTEVLYQPPVVYVASTATALQHEFLHFLWWASYPSEACTDGTLNQVWRAVEHGGGCDPFTPKP